MAWPTTKSTGDTIPASEYNSIATDGVHTAQDNNLGPHFLDVGEIAAPAAPSANTGRIFFDSADEVLKIKKSGGGVVSLEQSGVTSVFGRTGAVVAVSGDYTAALVTNAYDVSTDQSVGAHYIDIGEIATPGNPAADTGRLFFDSADEVLKVKKSGGTVVSLEQGGGSGTPGGANTEVQFNESGSFGGDPEFTWSTGSKLLTVQGSTDGSHVLLVLENAQAAAASSTNETAELRFGFGGNTDVARIVAGKAADYTSAANEDSFLALYADQDGTAVECARIDGVRQSLYISHDPSQDFLSGNAHGIKIHSASKTSVFEMVTDWDQTSVNSQYLARTFSGTSVSAGFIFRGRSLRGSVASPSATAINDALIRLSAGGYTNAEIDDRGAILCKAVSTWSASNAETEWTVDVTPNGTITPRTSMALRSGGILEVDANADGDVVRIKQGGVQEGQITVTGTTVAYETFTGAHPVQLKVAQQAPPAGAVVIATGEEIQPEVEYWERPDPTADSGITREYVPPLKAGRPDRGSIPQTWVRKTVPRAQLGADASRFSHIDGTTVAQDSRVYGVYVGETSNHAYGRTFGQNERAVHNVAGVGLYLIRVTDTAGDIAAGDYLTSSSRQWEAQKQADDALHSYTVAKALVPVLWAAEPVDATLGYKWKLIPATIHCG